MLLKQFTGGHVLHICFALFLLVILSTFFPFVFVPLLCGTCQISLYYSVMGEFIAF